MQSFGTLEIFGSTEPISDVNMEGRRRKKKVSVFTGRPFVHLAGGEWATGRYDEGGPHELAGACG